jgi:phenylacetate-CoA ligase
MDRTVGIYDAALETMSPRQRREYHDGRLRDIAGHAHQRSSHFRRRMHEAGLAPAELSGVTDLDRLPVLKKRALPELQRLEPPFGGLLAVPVDALARIYQSPGPIYEPEDRRPDYWRMARAFYAGGFRRSDIVQVTFAYHLTPGGWICESGLRALGCVVVPAGVGNTDAQVRLLRDLRVTGFVGTASFLSALLEKAEEQGYRVPGDLCLCVASVGGAMMGESMRRMMEDRYGLLVRQIYATADVGLIAYECHEASGMHIADDLILQIVDPDLETEVATGEAGEVVVTVFEPVYPLIRFGTGDLSAVTTEPCGCGRTSARLTRIMGRIDEVTKVKGMFVHPGQVDEIAGTFPEVRRCQVVVRHKGRDDDMVFRVELDTGASPEALLVRLSERVREVLQIRGQVEVVPHGTIADGAKTIVDERRWS